METQLIFYYLYKNNNMPFSAYLNSRFLGQFCAYRYRVAYLDLSIVQDNTLLWIPSEIAKTSDTHTVVYKDAMCIYTCLKWFDFQGKSAISCFKMSCTDNVNSTAHKCCQICVLHMIKYRTWRSARSQDVWIRSTGCRFKDHYVHFIGFGAS